MAMQMASMPKHYRQPDFSNISVRFSPFEADKIIVAQSQNFGIVGAGAVSVLKVGGPTLELVQQFQTPDSSFDACFSEANQNQVLQAGGDGTLKLFQIGNPQPLSVVRGHSAEV